MLTKEHEKYLLIAIVTLLVILIGFPVLMITIQTEVGDARITNRETPVYQTYHLGKLGEQVCTLSEGKEVEISEILTSNDLPNRGRTLVAEIKAFYIKTPNCDGWVLPQYLN